MDSGPHLEERGRAGAERSGLEAKHPHAEQGDSGTDLEDRERLGHDPLGFLDVHLERVEEVAVDVPIDEEPAVPARREAFFAGGRGLGGGHQARANPKCVAASITFATHRSMCS